MFVPRNIKVAASPDLKQTSCSPSLQIFFKASSTCLDTITTYLPTQNPKPKTAIMSASGVAAVINPHGPEGQQIHLFYNTNTKNLGFQFFDETKHSDETEAFAAGADAQTGFIINPAQVASTNLTGVDLVLGFTNKPKAAAAPDCKCEDPTQNDVSIISPVYQPLAATEVENLTIAATSSPTTAYVYYLT